MANGDGNTAATNTALAGTNIDLGGVPSQFYAGGFHNFNPASGQLDVAQLVNYPAACRARRASRCSGTIRTICARRNWTSADLHQQRHDHRHGHVGDVRSDQLAAVAVVRARHVVCDPGDRDSGDIDGIVSVIDSGGNVIINQDTGTDETVTFSPPTSGQYSIKVSRYASTTGTFSLTINTAHGVAGVTTDVNLLAFRVDTGALSRPRR